MAVNTSFVNDNKAHDALEWSNYFRKFITNGVFTDPANGLYVTNPSGRTLSVAPGVGFVNGVQIENTTALSLTCDATPSARVDRVVLRLDLGVPSGSIAVLKGTDGSTSAPFLANSSTKKELCLSEVTIDQNGIVSISDTRANASLCGFVQNFLGDIDATGLFANYEAEFNKTFVGMQKQVDDLIDQGQGAFAGFVNGAYSNAIINGNFKTDQRMNFRDHVCPVGQKYTLDRWLYRIDGAVSASHVVGHRDFGDPLVANQATSVISLSSKALTASGMSSIGQFIERGCELFGGGKVTVSFKAWANTAQKVAVNVQARFSASDVVNLTAPALSLPAREWKNYSVTFDCPKFPRDEKESFKVSIFNSWSGATANERFQTATDNNGNFDLFIGEVVCCKGSVAIPFSPPPVADQLAQCRRYYRKMGFTSLLVSFPKVGQMQKSQALDFSEMRVPPTVTCTDRAGTAAKCSWELRTSGIEDGHQCVPSSNSDGYTVTFAMSGSGASSQEQAVTALFGSIEADAEIYA